MLYKNYIYYTCTRAHNVLGVPKNDTFSKKIGEKSQMNLYEKLISHKSMSLKVRFSKISFSVNYGHQITFSSLCMHILPFYCCPLLAIISHYLKFESNTFRVLNFNSQIIQTCSFCPKKFYWIVLRFVMDISKK